MPVSLDLYASHGYVGPLASNSGWVDVLVSLDSAKVGGALKYLADNGYTEQPSVVAKQIGALLGKQSFEKSIASTLSNLKDLLDKVHGVAIVWDGVGKAPEPMPTERMSADAEPEQVLYVARHGETDDDSDDPDVGCASGWREVPLNAAGRQQAEDLARSLTGLGIVEIHASDLERTLETAKIVAARLSVKLVPEFGLRSWGLGQLTGKPDDEVKEKIQAGIDSPDEPPSPGAESYAHFIERYGKTVRALADRQQDLGKPILILTSSWNVGALPIILAGETPAKVPKIDPGEAFELTRSGDEDWEVTPLPEHPHIVASGPPMAIPGPMPGSLQQTMGVPERKAGPAPEVEASADSGAVTVQQVAPGRIGRVHRDAPDLLPGKQDDPERTQASDLFYSEDQPRDDHGQWTDGNASTVARAKELGVNLKYDDEPEGLRNRLESYGMPIPSQDEMNARLMDGLSKAQERGAVLPENVRVTTEGFGKANQIAQYDANSKELTVNPLSPYWHGAHESGQFSSDDPNHVIYHELGHADHAAADDRAYRTGIGAKLTGTEGALATDVSKRAAVSKSEFVAEVYAGRMAGKTFDKPTMALYSKLRGGKAEKLSAVALNSAASAAASVHVNLPLIIARKIKKLAADDPERTQASDLFYSEDQPRDSSGRWSEAGSSIEFARKPTDFEVDGALRRWQNGDNAVIGEEQTNLAGTQTYEKKSMLPDPKVDAAVLVHQVRNADPMEAELYRGIRVKPDDPVFSLKEGDEAHIRLQSFSRVHGVAEDFAQGRGERQDPKYAKDKALVPVMVTVDPGAKAVAMRGERWHAGEREVITGGRFSVVSTGGHGGVKEVRLRQTGVF